MHKWIPVPRPVGLLWATPELAQRIRPAVVSLTYDEPSLSKRFAWPGTFDPAPRLCLPDALDVHRSWAQAGELDRCRELADRAGEALAEAGAVPTGAAEFLPPRMRSFMLKGIPIFELRSQLLQADVRAWTGVHDERTSLLRLATHVYTDEQDIVLVARQIAALVRAVRG